MAINIKLMHFYSKARKYVGTLENTKPQPRQVLGV